MFKEGDFVFCIYIKKVGYLEKRRPKESKYDSTYLIEEYPFILQNHEYTRIGKYHKDSDEVYLKKIVETYLFKKVLTRSVRF